MRNLIILLAGVILVGGYSAYWYKKAEDFKQTTEQQISTLNDHAKALNKGTPLIRYESIRTSGYPFSMTLEIVKPVIDLPVTLLLKAFPKPPGTLPGLNYNWVEEISYNGTLSLSSSITGSQYTFIIDGDRSHKSMIENTVRHSFVSSSSTPFVCHLGIKPQIAAPWTLQPIFTDLKSFASAFRSFDCDMQGSVTKDSVTGAVLFSSDSFHEEISNQDADGNNRKFAFTLDSTHAKATPAADVLVNDYAQIAYAILGTPPARRMPAINMSAAGEQDAKIDLRYEGPTQAKDFADSAMHMRFDINAFNVKNALIDLVMELHVATAPQGDDRTALFAVHSTSEVAELYDQLIAKQVTAAFTSAMQDNTTNPGMNPNAALARSLLAQSGTPEEIAAAILPKLHSFGKTTFDIDSNAKGPKDLNSFFKRSNFTLGAFNWVAVPYGIKMKGSSDFSAAGKPPSGDLSITCLSCDALINDMGNYIMRIQTLFTRNHPQQPAFITPDLVEGVRQFLHGISENSNDKNAKDILIHFVMTNTGQFTISNKQLPEVMGLYMVTIAPRLPQPQVTAAPPPPPPLPPVGK